MLSRSFCAFVFLFFDLFEQEPLFIAALLGALFEAKLLQLLPLPAPGICGGVDELQQGCLLYTSPSPRD